MIDIDWGGLSTIIVGIGTAASGIAVGRSTSRAQVRTAELAQDDTPAWTEFTKSMSEQMTKLQLQVDKMQAQVDSLQTELRFTERLLDTAAAHIRAWRIAFPDRERWPRLPTILRTFMEGPSDED